MKKSLSFLLSLFLIIALTACGQTGNKGGRGPSENNITGGSDMNASDQFVLISGGSFQMGSPESSTAASTSFFR